MENKFETIIFNQKDLSLEVRFDKTEDTVWLNINEITKLFEIDSCEVTKHINDIYENGELDKNTTCRTSIKKTELETHKVNFYNLDMILAIGYRINSKIGIQFRKWTSSILQQYLIEGYAINNKRISFLNKTIEIQNKILTDNLNDEETQLMNIIDSYESALSLLDDYDHQCVVKPKGNKAQYSLEYNECRDFIDNMRFNNNSQIFGVEKEKGKLEGIIACINQTAFGEEVYTSLEEKAANLLYFIIKDHPFVDGCKRIAASLFLLYLSKNSLLYKNKLSLSNGTLVALTLLIAESKPDEKEIIVKIIMNILFNKL